MILKVRRSHFPWLAQIWNAFIHCHQHVTCKTWQYTEGIYPTRREEYKSCLGPSETCFHLLSWRESRESFLSRLFFLWYIRMFSVFHRHESPSSSSFWDGWNPVWWLASSHGFIVIIASFYFLTIKLVGDEASDWTILKLVLLSFPSSDGWLMIAATWLLAQYTSFPLAIIIIIFFSLSSSTIFVLIAWFLFLL